MRLELRTDGPGPHAGVTPCPKKTSRFMASSFLPLGATTGDSGGKLSSRDDSGNVESLQSWEIEASRSLAELFVKATAHLQGLVQVASREQLLYLYARYKQVK